MSSGPRLVAYLRSLPEPTCINVLFDGPGQLRRAAFREDNVLHVMTTAADLARIYNGTNFGNLTELFYFTRAAFYNEFYDDAISFSTNVYQAMAGALDDYLASPHLYDVTSAHGYVLREVFVCIDSISHGYRVRYLPIVKAWLASFGPDHAVHRDFLRAANALMVWLYRGHWDDAYLEVVLSDPEMADRLRDLALSDSLLADPGLRENREHLETVLANASRELARFLQYDSAPIQPRVTDAVERILARYDPTGEGAAMWMAAASHVFWNDACADFRICGAREDIESAVLSIEHDCGDGVRIRSQDMSPAQMFRACDELSEVETFFHEGLGTDREPVPGDLNDTLEIIVYTDWTNYDLYSGFLFGHPTDNGGIYIEGDPSDPDNVARFFAHLADWLPDEPVWNLQHEYVHYLDGRFNLWGDFGDVRVLSHKTIWWTEGLAEFMSNLGEPSGKLRDYLEGNVSRLEDIFSILDFRDLTLYPRSHLAMWFMFDRHEADILALRQLLREGAYDDYLDYVTDRIGDRYESAWRLWVAQRRAAVATEG